MFIFLSCPSDHLSLTISPSYARLGYRVELSVIDFLQMLRWSYPLWKGEYIIIFTGSSSRNSYWKHGPWTNSTCIWNRLSISAPPRLQSKPAQQQGSGEHIHPEVEEAVLTVPGAPSPSLLTLAMDLYVLCFCKWLVVAVFLIFSLAHLCGRLQAAGSLKTRKESLDQC